MTKLSINKILVPTDFSEPSLNALHYAAAMAKHSDAGIVLLHVMESYEQNVKLNEAINLNEQIRKAVNDKLKQIKNENIDLWGIPIEIDLVEGKIHKKILEYTENNAIDLVVMGTHGASGISNFGRLMLGTNAHRVVQRAQCPVITIREPKEKVTIKNIVLPLDTTKETKLKVRTAIKLAKVFGATVHVVSVSDFLDEFQHPLGELQAQLKEVANRMVREGIDTRVKMLRHESVSKSVLEYATGVDADLILIITREESKLNEWFLGSDARRIITQSKVPVLSLHPKEEAEAEKAEADAKKVVKS